MGMKYPEVSEAVVEPGLEVKPSQGDEHEVKMVVAEVNNMCVAQLSSQDVPTSRDDERLVCVAQLSSQDVPTSRDDERAVCVAQLNSVGVAWLSSIGTPGLVQAGPDPVIGVDLHMILVSGVDRYWTQWHSCPLAVVTLAEQTQTDKMKRRYASSCSQISYIFGFEKSTKMEKIS